MNTHPKKTLARIQGNQDKNSTVERHLSGINVVTFVKNFAAFVLKDFNTKFTKECTKFTDEMQSPRCCTGYYKYPAKTKFAGFLWFEPVTALRSRLPLGNSPLKLRWGTEYLHFSNKLKNVVGTQHITTSSDCLSQVATCNFNTTKATVSLQV
ncbi:MAG: hypothetical protein FWH27_08625 [Planctomycetaceae bacterium]|nr:hypothetical protein [Planctomycetaceae bacterium]